MNVPCPRPAAPPSLPVSDACAFKFDQILRQAFQRVQLDAAPFSTATPITSRAQWLALIAKTDASRIVVTPVFAGFVIPPSEATETGGNDNSTPFGIPSYGGESSVNVTYAYRNLSPRMIAALRAFSVEAIPLFGTYALTTYLFTKNGAIIYDQRKGAAAGDAHGLPIFNLRLATLGSEGLNADNISNAGFYLPAEWDETVAMVTPSNWNPLTDI